MYLHIYDDNPKHTLAQRLTDGAERYQARFGRAPNVIQVSVDEPGECQAERIRELTKNNYRFGWRDNGKA